ncbi:hypothetical protein D3C83_133540 [compost metagenome]
MGNAPGNIRPGRAPLVGELVGDVIEGQDGAVLIAHAVDGEHALTGFGIDLDVGLALLAGHEFGEVG